MLQEEIIMTVIPKFIKCDTTGHPQPKLLFTHSRAEDA